MALGQPISVGVGDWACNCCRCRSTADRRCHVRTAPSSAAAEADAAKPAEDALAFMRRAWGVLLAAVLPLWQDPALLAAHGDKVVQVRCPPAFLPPLSPLPCPRFLPGLPLGTIAARLLGLLGSAPGLQCPAC